MELNWIEMLSKLGWKRFDTLGLPLFSRIAGDRLYFTAMPDSASGVIPVPIFMSQEQQEILHNHLRQYSNNIYIGDLNDSWVVDDYKSMLVEYQVITPGKRLDKDVNYDIRKAKKAGVKIEEFDPDGYWECLMETAARQKRNGLNRWTYDALWKGFGGLVAKLGDLVIGGCIYSNEDDKIRYLHSASLSEYFSYRPNHLVMSHLLELANIENKEIWLGNAPKQLDGLRSFKESFGAEIRTFKLKYYEN